MSKQFSEIWNQIKINEEKLRQCERHVFIIDATPDKIFNKRWQCKFCGGEVSNTDRHWYEMGQSHGLN